MYVKSFFGKLRARAKAQQAADSYWRTVDSFDFAKLFPDRYEKQIRFTLEQFAARLKPTDMVIDLGCSDGWHTLAVAPFCAGIDGYDFSEKFIARARTAVAGKAEFRHCAFHVADVLKLELPPASADAAIVSGLTTCMTRDADALKAMRLASSTVKAGGYVLLKDTLHRGRGTQLNVSDAYGAAYRDRSAYGRLVARAGLEVLAEDWLNDAPDFASFVALARKRTP